MDIGIEGNEREDAAANLHSWSGDIRRLPNTTTSNGIVSRSKAIRKTYRTEKSYGTSRSSLYHSKALRAYTWTRTEKGPEKNCLHTIGKAESPTCQCGHPTSTEHHLTFHCPLLNTTRLQLIGDRKQWADLDDPIWIKSGPDQEDIFDGGGGVVRYSYSFLATFFFFFHIHYSCAY